MKKFLLLGIVLFGMIQLTFSQHPPMDEVVYLKNGSVIRGMIIEQVPNKSLKIKTADGNLFVFGMNEVEKITKEARGRRQRMDDQQPAIIEESTGKSGRWMGMVQFLGAGYQESSHGYDYYYDEGVAFLNYHFIYGYQFRNRFFVGGGVGMEHLIGDALSDSYNLRIPVFATAKINLNKRRVSPFFQFDGGYHFNSDEWIENGFFFLPKFGVDFNLGNSKRKALFLSLNLWELGKYTSYNYRSSYNYNGGYGGSYYYDDEYSYNDYEFYLKIGLNFGLRF